MIGFPDSLRPFGTALQYIKWLMRDEFYTAVVAPIASPHTAEPTGSWTVVDSASKLSISGGQLMSAINASNATLNDPLFISVNSFVRAAGLCFRFTHFNGATIATVHVGGWSSTRPTVTDIHSARTSWSGNSTIDITANQAVENTGDNESNSTAYTYFVILRALGAFYFVVGGAYTTPTLLFVDNAVGTSPLYPYLSFYRANAGNDDKYSAARVMQFSGVFASDFGIAAQNVTNPVSGQSYAGSADGLHLITVASGASLSGTGELRYRIQDANNYWTAYFDGTGAFKVDSVASGTPTNRINVASVAAANQTLNILVRARGTSHDFYTRLSGSVWIKRGSTVTVATGMDSQPNIASVVSGNYTSSKLEDYPSTSSNYNVLNAVY